MRRFVLFAVLAACKSPGTITLDFDLDGTTCAGFGSAASYLMYAEPGTGCNACACGGCAGTGSAVVIACPSCSKDQLHGLALDLSPGVWSVVVEAYDPSDPPMLLESQCLDVTIDADGTQGSTATNNNCTACNH